MINKQKSRLKTLFNYIVLGLIAAILIGAGISALVLEGAKLQIVWMGAALLVLNLLILLFFVGRNIR